MTKQAPKSFVAVYKILSPSLTRFIAKRLGTDYAKTEDILQNTAVAAWKSWSSFKHKSTYFTWLCRIALNKIADYYRDQVNQRSKFITPGLKRLALIESIESDEMDQAERLSLGELRQAVSSCLDLLAPDQRKLLQYKYWQGLTHKQIAKIMRSSERAIEGKLYRARASFAKVWKEY